MVRLSAWLGQAPILIWRVRPLRSILLYLGAVFIGGALLAPWLYRLVQWGSADFPALKPLADQPFHRYVDRSFVVLGLIGLWPFFCGIGASSWRDVGLGKPNWPRVGRGFGLGLISLALVVLLAVMAEARDLNFLHSAGEYGIHFRNALLATMAVPILEEVFFRGALFGGLRKVYPWRLALLLSSLLYALLHFLQRPEPPAAIDWTSGLALLPRMAQGFADWQRLVPGFINLTLAGLILGLAYHRSGDLYFSMGLHGGWIFWVKSYAFLTREIPGGATWFWGSGRLIDGALASIILLITLVVCQRQPFGPHSASASGRPL